MNSNSILKDKIEIKLEEYSIRNAIIIIIIIIEVVGDEVSLKGIVDSYEVKDKIEQIILNFSEVQSVNNELAIYNEN